MRPVYFDLSTTDVSASRAFFETVLGWRFEAFDAVPGYLLIRTGETGQPGIDGGLGDVASAPVTQGRPLTVVTVAVPDLDAVLVAVHRAGGSVVEPPRTISGVGRYATCAEPGGVLFGVLQAAQPNPSRAAAGPDAQTI